MSELSVDLEPIACRRALEALRAGVPNRDVVRLLPPPQSRALRAFDGLLDETEASWGEAGKRPQGLLLAGGYGAGKSHLLEYLRHIALEANFVVSRIVLNKETPLCDLEKLYRTAVEGAEAPDRVGPALSAVAEDFRPAKMPYWLDLFRWAHQEEGLDPRFAATLFAFEKAGMLDEEIREKILAEWTGYPMKVGDLRAALRQCGETGYTVSRPAKSQAHRRFEFLARFFRAAGYAGWVLLLDEAEWVARYSLRQRGHAYAHLAQLLGDDRAQAVPGVAAVFAITDDYTSQVLRADWSKVPAKMQELQDPRKEAAERGMRQIEAKGLLLLPPSPDQVRQTYERVRALYAAAYPAASPPADIRDALEYAASTRMREYVRAWINLWDLRRLYGYAAHLVTETLQVALTEDKDLQASADEHAPSDEIFVDD